MRRSRLLNERTLSRARMVGLLILCLAGRLSADEKGLPDSLAIPGHADGVTSGSTSARMEITLGGGLFFPVGKWSDGFDPGASVGVGFDLPLSEKIDIGGRFSRSTLKRGNRANFKWFSMEAEVMYYPPLEVSYVEPFVLGRSGLLLAAVEVGEGREDEWDVLTGVGGGVRIPISEDFRFVGRALWNRVFGEGQGFHFTVGLSFPVF